MNPQDTSLQGYKHFEKDQVPNGRTVDEIPNYPAPEGTEVTYYASGIARRYKMVSGEWLFMPLLRSLSSSTAYNPTSVADGASTPQTVTIAGAALGDFVLASFSLDLQGLLLTAWVSAADTVTVRLENHTGASVDLASGTLNVRVIPQNQI